MNREQVAAEIEAKHQRRTAAGQRTIGNAPDVLSAREAFRQAVSGLPGVSADPDTVPDIMFFADCLVQRKEQLDTRAGHFDRTH